MDEGATTVLIGIGGSATNDGGMGVLSALGMRFLDSCGCELPPCGASLAHVSSIDYSELDARIKQTSFRVMCDVDNPLVGPRGATAVFGPQKGVTDSNFEILEQGMTSYAALLEKIFGEDVASMPGAGAAGGLGCALHTFLGAELVSGASCILDLANFDELLRESSFCITGEGHLDAQTAGGKAVAVVAERCAKFQVPCFVIAGGSDATPEDLRTMGLAALETCDGGGRGMMRLCYTLVKHSLRLLDDSSFVFSMVSLMFLCRSEVKREKMTGLYKGKVRDGTSPKIGDARSSGGPDWCISRIISPWCGCLRLMKEWAGYVPGVLPHSRFGQFRAVWHGIPDSIGRWLFVQQEYGLNLILMHLR